MPFASVGVRIAMACALSMLIGSVMGITRMDLAIRYANSNEENARAAQMLRNQMHADTMHDALRADVLASITYAESRSIEGQSWTYHEVQSHANQMRAVFNKNLELAPDQLVRQRLSTLQVQIEAYISAAIAIESASRTDLAKAKSLLAAFEAQYRELDAPMTAAGLEFVKISEAIIEEHREWAATAKLMTLLVMFTAGLLGIAFLVYLNLAVLRPINQMRSAMEGLAAGRVDVLPPMLGQNDEIGSMAKSVEIFRQTAIARMEAERVAEQKRRDADHAQAASQAKSQFLANMSHEIRTPLNGVLGMAQALQADGLSPGQREKVSIILDSGKSLMSLLNDVLDLSKIEAGKLEIATVAGDLLHTMKRTHQLFAVQAQEKGLAMEVRQEGEIPARLAYDPVRVRQCVSNLLSNAVKFTSQGRIDVSVSAQALGGGVHRVQIDVADTGIGIDETVAPRLFEVFTQADGATTRKFGGTGLGLAISRHLARLMGGDIVILSTPGKGSTFRFTFLAKAAPLVPEQLQALAHANDVHRETGRSLRGVRVLITDDNVVNRQVLRLFLGPLGCELSEASNGQEALDLLASQAFDIVLLDIHMPVMDGQETIRRIRASAEPWRALPVIALTADAMEGDRDRYLGMGMTAYLTKPIDQRALLAALGRVLVSPDRGEDVRVTA